MGVEAAGLNVMCPVRGFQALSQPRSEAVERLGSAALDTLKRSAGTENVRCNRLVMLQQHTCQTANLDRCNVQSNPPPTIAPLTSPKTIPKTLNCIIALSTSLK